MAAGVISAALLACSPGAGAAILLRAAYDPAGATTVPRSFLGLSTDWPVVYETIEGGVSPRDSLYARLIGNLSAFGGGAPTLRVGGHLQDYSWWDPSGEAFCSFPGESGCISAPTTLGVQYNITPAMLNALATSIRVTGQQLILGINMGANDIALAAQEINAMQQRIPQRYVLAYDIGNEPEGYGVRTLYQTTSKGHTVVHMMRPPSWNTQRIQALYDSNLAAFARALERLHPRPRLSADSGYGATIKPGPLLAADHRWLAMYTQHNYIGTACQPDGLPWPVGSPQRPTIAKLLSDNWEYDTLAANGRAAAAAHHYDLPYRVTEWQSYACGGAGDVSNAFAATLWGVDELFLNLISGVDGVDMHMDSPTYTPFYVEQTAGGQAVAHINSLYYAMLLFAQATGHRARLLPEVTFGEQVARGANVHVWGTRDSAGNLHFVIVNKDLHRAGRVVISVPGARVPGTVIRVTAPNPSAESGIELGGQTFAQPSATGQLTGKAVRQIVMAHDGAYTFTVAKASIAMLAVAHSGR